MKAASLALAEKTAKDLQSEKSVPEIIVEKVQSVAISWRDKLKAERDRQIEHHKESLQVKIQAAREILEKGRYPIEMEPTSLLQKIKQKGRGLDRDFEK